MSKRHERRMEKLQVPFHILGRPPRRQLASKEKANGVKSLDGLPL
jgi:hypothetical protein